MITLEELKNISNFTLEKKYQHIIDGIEEKLRSAAYQGRHRATVAFFSTLDNNPENEAKLLFNKHVNASPYIFGDKQDQEFIIEELQGNMKKVYEHCVSKNLNPTIIYTEDKTDAGYAIVIKW